MDLFCDELFRVCPFIRNYRNRNSAKFELTFRKLSEEKQSLLKYNWKKRKLLDRYVNILNKQYRELAIFIFTRRHTQVTTFLFPCAKKLRFLVK